MVHTVFILLLLASSTTGSSSATSATRKKGFSGFLGGSPCGDAKALGLGDSWYYSWLNTPYGQRNACEKEVKAGTLLAAEFVPMIIGIGVAPNKLSPTFVEDWKSTNAQYLLGYNEPDYGNGHNHPHMMSPADAAKDWPNVQKVAAMFDPPLQLVAPAVSSSGTDAWDVDGASPWLDYFFGNCTSVVADCDPSLIVHIAMHDYEGDVKKLARRIDGAASRYKRKLWLTEFAILGKWGSPALRAEQDAFLPGALAWLDASPNVFRYAWFTSRNTPNKMNGGR